MKRRTTTIAVLAAFALSVPAHAQGPSSDAYGGNGKVADQVDQGGSGPGAATGGPGAASKAPGATATRARTVASGALPFTGFDAGLLAGGGLLLLALGAALRRAARPRGVGA